MPFAELGKPIQKFFQDGHTCKAIRQDRDWLLDTRRECESARRHSLFYMPSPCNSGAAPCNVGQRMVSISCRDARKVLWCDLFSWLEALKPDHQEPAWQPAVLGNGPAIAVPNRHKSEDLLFVLPPLTLTRANNKHEAEAICALHRHAGGGTRQCFWISCTCCSVLK